MNAYPDGHRCRYELREGNGPRGGRRTWTVATCVQCDATAEDQAKTPGSDRSQYARKALVAAVPSCPKVPPRGGPERALDALAKAIRDGARVVPPLEWIVEFGAEASSPDAAIQRAWKYCDDPDSMAGLVLALWPSCGMHHSDELGESALVSLNVDGVRTSFQGPPAKVATALRRHVPAIAWQFAPAAGAPR